MESEHSPLGHRAVPDPEIAAQMGGLYDDDPYREEESSEPQEVGAYEPPINPEGASPIAKRERFPRQWTVAEQIAHLHIATGRATADEKRRSLEEHAARIQGQISDDGTFHASGK